MRGAFELLVVAIVTVTVTYLESTVGFASAVLVRRGQVLPEQAVVDVTATVEVEQGREGGGLCRVSLGTGFLDLGQGAIEAVDVGLVVVLVMQFHDLARDVGFEGTVVIWDGRGATGQPRRRYRSLLFSSFGCLQGRSGSVALPRTKEALARAAPAGLTELARSAARADGATRKRLVAMMKWYRSIELGGMQVLDGFNG